jgi:hypothetical protein
MSDQTINQLRTFLKHLNVRFDKLGHTIMANALKIINRY